MDPSAPPQEPVHLKCCWREPASVGLATQESRDVQVVDLLPRQLTQTRLRPLITLRLGHEKYASWKAFLDHAYWSVELK